MFHSEIISHHEKLNKEVRSFKEIPIVSAVTSQQVSDNFYQIKMDVKQLIAKEVQHLKTNRTVCD